MKNIRNIFLLLSMMLLTITSVVATGEITQDADKINYWLADSHTVTVENTGTDPTFVTFVSPWTVTGAVADCIDNGGNNISCSLDASATGTYTVTSDASVGEYATTAFTLTSNNSYTSETVNFIRIKDEEISRTLVEYGRGRGNYFYDSGSLNVKGGEQCTDLPADTSMELNYLHKVFPIINNYLNIPSAEGESLTLNCIYPNQTVVKQHLATDIAVTDSDVSVNYSSDWVKNSWEKVFFLVQDFDSGEYSAGDYMHVNCSSMSYYLPEANGYVTVDTDSLQFDFVDPTPLTASAILGDGITQIGTGTQEVPITYVITNTEDMTLSSSSNPIMVDIQAPPYAEFIGTRGELWGTGETIYHTELNSIDPLESVNITLVARFETAGTGTLDLSEGISVSYVPCWQINAYNPLTTEQTLTVSEQITVNASAVATTNIITEIADIQTDLANIEAKIDLLTTYSLQINSTVTTIEGYVDTLETGQSTIIGYVDTLETGQSTIISNQGVMTTYLDYINATTVDTNNIVTSIQTTVDSHTSDLEVIGTQVNATYDFLTTDIVNDLTVLGLVTNDTNVVVNQLNNTANQLQVTVNDINSTVNNIELYVTSGNVTLGNIESTVNTIDGNVAENLAITQYLNGTVWNGITAQDILNSIASVNSSGNFNVLSEQLTNLTTDLRQLEEFEEESIYLITDSITEGQKAYAEALTAVEGGNTEIAIEKLQESMNLLVSADQQIQQLKEEAKVELATAEKTTTTVAERQSILEKVIRWISGLFT